MKEGPVLSSQFAELDAFVKARKAGEAKAAARAAIEAALAGRMLVQPSIYNGEPAWVATVEIPNFPGSGIDGEQLIQYRFPARTHDDAVEAAKAWAEGLKW